MTRLWLTLLGFVTGIVLIFVANNHVGLSLIGFAGFGAICGSTTERLEHICFLGLGIFIGVMATFITTLGLALGLDATIIGLGLGLLYGLPGAAIFLLTAGAFLLLWRYLTKRKAGDPKPQP